MDKSANPNNKNHKDLETKIKDYLVARDFYVETLTYHNVMKGKSAAAADRLKRIDKPTALAIRGEPGLLAIHRTKNIVFYVEPKTNGLKWRNCSIEVLPLIEHRRSKKKCLYVYWDTKSKFDGCIWADDLSSDDIMRVAIPERWSDQYDWIESRIESEFPGVDIEKGGSSGGSNDPYLLIAEYHIEEIMPKFPSVVDEMVESPESFDNWDID